MEYTIRLDRLLESPDLPLLAALNEATYHELAIVVRRHAGESSIYCVRHDWESMPAAKDVKIAELEQLVAQLKSELAAAQRVPPAVAAAATGMQAAIEEPPPAETHACPEVDCGRSFASARALAMHRGRTHGAWKLDLESPPELPPDVEAPWICAQCHTSTHARSLTDPARCMRCVATPATMNGHHAAATA